MTPLEKIEELVSDDFAFDIEGFEVFAKEFTQDQALEMARRLGVIYMITHSHNKNHSCYGVHENWRKMV